MGPCGQGAPIQTKGPHGQGAHTYKGPIQTKDPYRGCVIPTHKGPFAHNLRPLETIRGPYRQGTDLKEKSNILIQKMRHRVYIKNELYIVIG